MPFRLQTLINSHNPRFFIIWAVVWVVTLGALDIAYNSPVPLAPFYMPAVFIFTWFAGLRRAFLFCVGATAVSVFARLGDIPGETLAEISLTIGLAIFINFILFAAISAALRRQARWASQDALTGLANRRALDAYLHREIDRCRRRGQPLTVGFIDCDDFKKINDALGHHAGDRVLQMVGRTVGRSIRRTDLGARLGGDEFVVVMPETNSRNARRAFENLRRELSRGASAERLPATFSMGVATFERMPDNAEELLGHADALMFRVKKTGKDSLITSVVNGRPPVRLRELAGTAGDRRP